MSSRQGSSAGGGRSGPSSSSSASSFSAHRDRSLSLASVSSLSSALGNILGSEFELEIMLESDDGSSDDNSLLLDVQLGDLSGLLGIGGGRGGNRGSGAASPSAASSRSRASSVALPDSILEAIVATALDVIDQVQVSIGILTMSSLKTHESE